MTPTDAEFLLRQLEDGYAPRPAPWEHKGKRSAWLDLLGRYDRDIAVEALRALVLSEPKWWPSYFQVEAELERCSRAHPLARKSPRTSTCDGSRWLPADPDALGQSPTNTYVPCPDCFTASEPCHPTPAERFPSLDEGLAIAWKAMLDEAATDGRPANPAALGRWAQALGVEGGPNTARG